MSRQRLTWALGVAILMAGVGCGQAAVPTSTAPPVPTAMPAPTQTPAPTPTPVELGIGMSRQQVIDAIKKQGIPITFYEVATVNGRPDVVGRFVAGGGRVDLIGPAADLDGVVFTGYTSGDFSLVRTLSIESKMAVVNAIDPSWADTYKAWVRKRELDIYYGTGNPALLPYNRQIHNGRSYTFESDANSVRLTIQRAVPGDTGQDTA